MNSSNHRQIIWDDLPGYVATVAPLIEKMDQCSIQYESTSAAHLFLLQDGLLAITDVYIPDEEEPSDQLLLAIGRILVAHRRACKQGLSLTS